MQGPAHLVIHLQLRRSADLIVRLWCTLSLICCSDLSLLRWWLRVRWHIHLLAIATSLRPSLVVVLNVLGLLFVRLAD